MNNEEKALVKAKKIECIIGMILLLPSILGIVSFLIVYFEQIGNKFYWLFDTYSDSGSSPAAIFIGLLALAGVYLIKDSFKYFFYSEDK